MPEPRENIENNFVPLEGAKLSETDKQRTVSRQEKIKTLQQKETTPTVSDASPAIKAVSETKFDFGIPKIDFDAATMETAYDLLGDPTNALAKITARRLNELDTEYKGQVTYADLTSGS